ERHPCRPVRRPHPGRGGRRRRPPGLLHRPRPGRPGLRRGPRARRRARRQPVRRAWPRPM
ncbi:MAG: hypothetical protein AVDCRST_MAG54-2871, partial [uncultured Actinomycetospora sp.]